MRSPASTVVKLTTMSSADPAAPAITSASREPDGIRIRFSATAPTTPVGDFTFDVITRAAGHAKRHSRGRAAAIRLTGDQYELTFDGTEVPSGALIHIRITDPLGRTAESTGESVP
jgi:hypothetical protein